jgi:hypothetical protein
MIGEWKRPEDTGPIVAPTHGRQGREADDEWLDALVTRFAEQEPGRGVS